MPTCMKRNRNRKEKTNIRKTRMVSGLNSMIFLSWLPQKTSFCQVTGPHSKKIGLEKPAECP